MKIQKSQEIFAMYSIWAGIRTSVPSMNPISFIIWLSMEKKNTIMIHECNWWQGSNSYSAAGGMLRSRPGHWGGTPTCQGTRNTSATAAPLPGVSNTSF